MKRARLHDGTEMEFPDGTPDNIVQMTVKKHLGVKPEPDPASVRHDETMAMQHDHVAVLSSISRAVAHSAEKVSGALGKLDGIGKLDELTGIKECLQECTHEIVLAMGRLAASIDRASRDVTKAVTAPKEIVRDKFGKPVSIKVETGAT